MENPLINFKYSLLYTTIVLSMLCMIIACSKKSIRAKGTNYKIYIIYNGLRVEVQNIKPDTLGWTY